MKKQIEDEGWETNRYKKLRITRKSAFYCDCDMEMMGKGEKCSKTKRKKCYDKRKLKHY